MEKNDKFEFLIYRKNFLSNEECDKIIKSLDTEDLTEGELVGDYEGGTINKNVRKTLNKDIIFDRINKPFDDKALFNKIESALKIANIQYFNYDVEGLDKLRFLKYGIGGRYEWHTDYGRHECSMRKLTGIIQLSDSNDYEGGDFEFGLTDTEGNCGPLDLYVSIYFKLHQFADGSKHSTTNLLKFKIIRNLRY